MMQNYIDILRQLNYELVKELGLFKHHSVSGISSII